MTQMGLPKGNEMTRFYSPCGVSRIYHTGGLCENAFVTAERSNIKLRYFNAWPRSEV